MNNKKAIQKKKKIPEDLTEHFSKDTQMARTHRDVQHH